MHEPSPTAPVEPVQFASMHVASVEQESLSQLAPVQAASMHVASVEPVAQAEGQPAQSQGSQVNSDWVASVALQSQSLATKADKGPTVRASRPYYPNRRLVNGPLNAPASLSVATPVETVAPVPLATVATPAPPVSSALLVRDPEILSVLYLFAGKERRADVGDHLRTLCAATGLQVKVVEVDILRDPVKHDLLSDQAWAELVRRVSDHEFQMVMATPPCNTHSRVVWANSQGPRPLRSKRYPMGFPWLEGAQLLKCRQANLLVSRSLEIAALAASIGAFFLIEHPEDLGTTATGGDPASIWSLEEVFQLQRNTSATTCVFFQCTFGLDAQKPTRLLGTLPMMAGQQWRSWPKFTNQGKYLGPLPMGCGHKHKRLTTGRNSLGEFNTASLAMYPSEMSFWIASMVLDAWQSLSRLKEGFSEVVAPIRTVSVQSLPTGEEAQEPFFLDEKPLPELEPVTSDEEEPGVRRVPYRPAGRGPCLKARWGGKVRDLHDGAGLCSPGRWLPADRLVPNWKGLEVLRNKWICLIHTHVPDVQRAVMKMACAQATESPFPTAMLVEARGIWQDVLRSESTALPSDRDLLVVVESQPFLLTAISETLREIGDPDFRIFDGAKESFSTGVPIGFQCKLPRTPAVFERKTKFRSYEEGDSNLFMDNFTTVRGHEEELENQFKAEAQLGMMVEVSLEEAKRLYPAGRLRIAGLGAIEKSDLSFRVLHDGTHGVDVNAGLRPRDRQRMPTAGDLRTSLAHCSTVPGVHFSLQADLSKAHRRYRHLQSDWGLQACSLKKGSVWLNKVGTFGIGTASYWFSRLAAGVGRFALSLMGSAEVWQWIFADDLRFTCNGASKYENLLLFMLCWEAAGSPFSWSKCRGGLAQDWVGYWVDCSTFQVGASVARTAWMVRWITETVCSGKVLVRSLQEGLGRMGFMAGALEWAKPFLAACYAWTASVPGGAFLPLPPIVSLTLEFIKDRLVEGARLTDCRATSKELGLLFKADTKGEIDKVVIGGWECRGGTVESEARWFSLTILPSDAPWLFDKGHSSKTIASGELLATLASVQLFCADDSPGEGSMGMSGLTDNRGNTFVLAKMLSTKYPLAIVLMQLSVLLSEKKVWLGLDWVPREDNASADALTNDDFGLFNMALRIPLRFEDLRLEVVQKFATPYRDMMLAREKRKLEPVRAVLKPAKKRGRKISSLDPW